jgi:magnesium transporter
MAMDVRLLTEAGIEHHPVDDLKALLARDDGVVWVDIASCDEAATQMLADVFQFHPMAIRDCVERNRVPRVHVYSDHAFVVLHSPELGKAGHVHYVELDQFIGERYLVTVHGPVNPAVPPDVPLRETRAVLARVEAGRAHPTTAFALSYSIVTALTRYQEAFVEMLTRDVWRLEQQVTSGHFGDPEQLLEELFRARHGLLAVRTMAALSREAYGRLGVVSRSISLVDRPLVADLFDQFNRVRDVADGQREYLQGVIEFYRTRTETKMTIAAERLAVIAVVTLPITALSSIYGMNIIVNAETDFVLLAIALIVMAAISGVLLRWAKRQGWW